MTWPFGGTEVREMRWETAFDGTSDRGSPASRATYLAPVFSAIRHIVDYGSSLPLIPSRLNADGSRSAAPMPQLFAQLDAPGGIGTNQWIGQALYGLAVHGNAVGWINAWDGFGYPTSISWLRRSYWSFDEAQHQWVIAGQVAPWDRVVHIPWIVPIGYTVAMSPVEHFASMIGAGLSAQDYANVGRGGGIPPAILRNTGKTIKRRQARAVQEALQRDLASNRPFVTGSDWDLTMVTIPPNQLQFLETLKLTADQTASIYGLNPLEVGGNAPGGLHYTTDEGRMLERASNMRPYLERLEAAFFRLLPSRQCVEFNVEATLRTDLVSQTNLLGVQIDKGIRSPNEARQVIGLEPRTGGDTFATTAAPAPPAVTREGEGS